MGKEAEALYRRHGRNERMKIDGNLAVARATASKVSAAIEENRPSPFGFQRIAIGDCIDSFIDYCENVKALSFRTLDRYRAALSHFVEFANTRNSPKTVD